MSEGPAHSNGEKGEAKKRDVNPPGKSAPRKSAGLLLAGAAALALLLGGGYYAWQNSSPSQVASADKSLSFTASPGENEANATAEKSATADAGERSTTSAQQVKPKKARAAAIPEETIGVSRASRTDDIVINAKRRAVWRYAPRAERLAEYYPAYALERGREGEARLHCMIGEKGKLDCERISEQPARAGFGAAALQVARTLRHADRRADGRNAIGTPLNLRVLFRVADNDRRG